MAIGVFVVTELLRTVNAQMRHRGIPMNDKD